MRFYHTVGEGWQPGQPLLSYNALLAAGAPPAWRWPDAEEGWCGDVVCLFESPQDARDFQREFGGVAILALDLPVALMERNLGNILYSEDVPGQIRRWDHEEGYLAVQSGIPAAWIVSAEEDAR